MRATHLFLAASVIIASVLTSCTQTEAPPYPVIDSGVYAWNHERPYWLDEHRVMFVGYAGEQPKSRDEALRMTPSIYLWDTKSGDIELYRKNARRLCIADNYIRYVVPARRENGGISYEVEGWYGGEIGREVYFPGPGHLTVAEGWRFNPNSCRYQAIPIGMTGTIWKALRREHGHILFMYRTGRHAFDELPAELHTAGNEIVSLPFNDPTLSTVLYFVGRDEYLVSKISSCSKYEEVNQVCDEIWWMDERGQVELISIPLGPWGLNASAQYYPAFEGVILVSDNFRSTTESGEAGLYHVSGSTYEKLITGKVRSVGVAPSGCWLSFDHSYLPLPRSREDIHWFTLKAINICAS